MKIEKRKSIKVQGWLKRRSGYGGDLFTDYEFRTHSDHEKLLDALLYNDETGGPTITIEFTPTEWVSPFKVRAPEESV